MRALRRSIVPSLLIVLSLAACSSGNATLPSATAGLGGPRGAMTDPAILRHLSPALSPSERRYMYDIIAKLPPRFRENVIVFKQDGSVYANDPALLANFQTWTQLPGRRDMVRDRQGRIMPSPSDLPSLGTPEMRPNFTTLCPDNKGLCFARYSDYGKNYVQANVGFPCGALSLVKASSPTTNDGDGGLAYIGVNSNTLTVDGGITVKIYNNPNNPPPVTFTSYQVFMNAGIAYSKYTFSPSPEHLACPVTTTLTYQPLSSKLVFLGYQGSDVTGGTYPGGPVMGNTVTVLADLSGSNYTAQFGSACNASSKCKVKRITALTTPGRTAKADGSYFGVKNVNSAPAPAVAWTGADSGIVASAGGTVTYGPFWEGNTNGQGDFLGVPNVDLCITGQGPGNWGTSFETIGLNWTPNPLPGPYCTN